ncbi:hypothetical protein CDL12_25957 [Handroanthus impetiginosus]|uniref:Disease resistance R13L4/SHOC-2-like LRR domain-containing protein n=1 Tax=Handroanthus impetiginosus TaxID=429701 RepID=A0A2G9G8C9_9LAMI|nr:hypothetical protein CDL12_25957 [Handroanthus impetiginosus]
MGQFPNCKNIEADKLYFLLAAEDLILPGDSEKEKTSHMESLRKMLQNLAYKKLVEAQEDKVSTTRMYKSCRLHAKTRSFCMIKGEDEDFFEIVDIKDQKKVRTSTRRLAVYLGKNEDGDAIQFMSRDTVRKIRTLLIFGTSDSKEKSWPEEITYLKEFSHLRVLDFDWVNFNVRKPPKGMDKLVLLRYLGLRECFLETLLSAISKLPGLETLDLRCKMTLRKFLSNLKRLRHLFFPVVYECDGNGKLQLQGFQMVEIPVNFDTGACDIDDLSHFHNLQILTTILEGKHDDIAGIIKYLDAKKANNLRQSCPEIRTSTVTRHANIYIHLLHIEGQIGDSLKEVEISPNFTEMVVDGSELDDDPMNILGKLTDLRRLTLCNDAFIGREMTISTWSKFPELRILKLMNLQYLQKVTFKEGTMPKLSTLEIKKCEGLEKVMMSKAWDNRLPLAQAKKRDDVYLVEPPLQ